jgi:hypothetical protein
MLMKTNIMLDATPIDVTVTMIGSSSLWQTVASCPRRLPGFRACQTLPPSKEGNGGSSGADMAFTGPRSMRTSPSQACFGLLE